MATGHCATISFFIPLANTTSIRSKRLVLSSLSTPFPSKLTKRKNYLRPKLLKTLKKPYTIPEIPTESQEEQPLKFPSGEFQSGPRPPVAEEELNVAQFEEIRTSEASEVVGALDNGAGNVTTGSFLKFGLYLVGIFVFQTVCAVWILGSPNSDHKEGNVDNEDKTRVSELGMKGDIGAKSKLLFNGSGNSLYVNLGIDKVGSVLYVDESELEKKIVEIQAMAKDVRERERLKSKDSSLSDEDGDVLKSGIGKEVNNRLFKLRKRLKSDREKLPISFNSHLIRNNKVGDRDNKGSSVVEVANEELMFEKKNKFRSSLVKPSTTPKGFQGSEDRGCTQTRSGSLASEDQSVANGSVDNSRVELEKLGSSGSQVQVNDAVGLVEDAGKKSTGEGLKSLRIAKRNSRKERRRKKVGVDSNGSKIGVAQDSSSGIPPLIPMESRDSSELEAQTSRSYAEESHDTAEIAAKNDTLLRNDSLKPKEVERKQADEQLRVKKSEFETDLWWLSLPYVIGILMRRGHDGEGPQGLFTLKNTSEDDSSYTVAFEDRGDATNFCYILHSFFEDLGDFDADILPMSTKELDEAVKSQTMKLIVVRKGQLKLYAGQPLTDVEMALHSLIKQNSIRS